MTADLIPFPRPPAPKQRRFTYESEVIAHCLDAIGGCCHPDLTPQLADLFLVEMRKAGFVIVAESLMFGEPDFPV